MFDKLTLNYEWDGGDFSPSLGNLEVAWESRDSRTGEERTDGYIMGMRVSVWPERKRMRIEGSIAKFLFHENVTMLTRETTQEALENLGEALGIDIGKARVSTLEFGVNIVVQREPWLYLQRLGDMPRRERLEYSHNTLYYKRKGREQPDELKIYDKGKESKRKSNKGMQIPLEMRGKHILRFELSLNSRLPQQLDMEEIKASSLCTCEVWEKLKAMLLEKYESITKISKNGIDTKRIRSPKDAKEGFLSFLGADVDLAGSVDAYIAMLKANNAFKDRRYYTRTESALKKDISKSSLLETDGLIEELDEAFSSL